MNIEDIPERNLNQKLQEVKANEFFHLLLVSLNKHYGRFANELLFLVLFDEAPLAIRSLPDYSNTRHLCLKRLMALYITTKILADAK